MNISKEQWQKIGGIVLTAVLGIAAVLGWWFPVSQPEQGGFSPQAVRERIAIDSREDSYVYNGADVRWYSDDHSTEIHRIDGAGGVEFAAPTAQATATPGVVVDCSHVGNCLEVRIASTPVAYYDSSGNYVGAGTFDVQGDITLENDETISNSTDGIVAVSGSLSYKHPLVETSESYTLTAEHSGYLVTNAGASGTITITLPSLADGLNYCVFEDENQSIVIEPDGTDQILSETNAGGDSITSGAQFDVMCLIAINSGWVPIDVIGTWSDTN